MSDNIRQILTDNLNGLLKSKGIKAIDLAEKVGVSKSAVSHWLAGDNSPNIEVLAKICQIYDVKMSDILSDKTEFSYYEKQHIKKYRTLDEYGKKAIDNLLDTEYERCQNENKIRVLQLPMSELKASAGTGNWLEDNTYNTVEVADTTSARKADLIIEVSGDSMEPTYSDGDNVLVRLQPSVDIGEIGIFIKDNEGYIKELGRNRLISHNKDYPDILLNEFNDVRCVGKVIGLAEMV